jgi:hypothetical protein
MIKNESIPEHIILISKDDYVNEIEDFLSIRLIKMKADMIDMETGNHRANIGLAQTLGSSIDYYLKMAQQLSVTRNLDDKFYDFFRDSRDNLVGFKHKKRPWSMIQATGKGYMMSCRAEDMPRTGEDKGLGGQYL